MRGKQSVWVIAGLSALLLSGVVFADKELDDLMNPKEKPKSVSKPKPKPHPKPVKKAHKVQKTEVDYSPEPAAEIPQPAPNETKQPLEPEMVAITGGCFQMGSPKSEKDRSDDEKQHRVCVKDFQLGKYEVTQAQWQAVMGNNPSNFKGENLPVEQVSWNDVQSFLEKLNAKTGKNYRLPTEAEWEYAARAGTTTPFYTGNCINTNQANYDGNYDYNNCGAKTGVYKQKTVAVGSYPANPWGLYDMAGNVWEWMCSVYSENYDGNELKCGTNGSERVVRGGSWGHFGRLARSAYRDWSGAGIRYGGLGFRFALGLPAQ